MPATFDTTVTAPNGQFSTQVTYSHTVESAAKILLVHSQVDRAATSVIGVTYNGVSLTQLLSNTYIDERFYVHYLINPSSGANNVVISFDNNLAKTPAASISLFGASTDVPSVAFNTAVFATGISNGIPLTSTGQIGIDFVSAHQLVLPTITGGNTQLYNFLQFGTGVPHSASYAQSNGTFFMGWSRNGTGLIAQAGILVESGSAGSPATLHTGTLMLLGTGF